MAGRGANGVELNWAEDNGERRFDLRTEGEAAGCDGTVVQNVVNNPTLTTFCTTVPSQPAASPSVRRSNRLSPLSSAQLSSTPLAPRPAIHPTTRSRQVHLYLPTTTPSTTHPR